VIVVADTSVLINLALVGQDGLLIALFREVIVPRAVEREFARLAASDGRFAGLRLPTWIEIREPQSVPASSARNTTLDAGEAEALALAVEIRADAVLIDETIGRAVALELGLTPISVFGILVRAKRHGQLSAVASVVNELLTRARFRAAPELVHEVLRLAGEA